MSRPCWRPFGSSSRRIGLESGDRTLECGEPLRELDLEGGHLVILHRYPDEDVTRQETESELVRVANHDGLVDPEVQRAGQ